MADKKRLIELTRKLIRIDSQNPPGDESRIADFVRHYLIRLGLTPKIYTFKKNRPNIVATLAGKDKKHSLLITPHLDTVPAGISWKRDPFAAVISRGKLYGLGATDCKCNLAVSLEAINTLVEQKADLGYNLVFAATADEESGSGLGLIPLLEKKILKVDAALVLDADEFDIVITQKGLMHFKVKICGKRAHGAYPWRGINAIDLALKIIQEIKGYKFSTPRNKYLRPPTINIGTIRGGDKVNVVADWCEFELDFRFLPGMQAQKLLAKIKEIIRKHSPKFKIEIEGIQEPYFIRETHPLVTQLKKSLQRQKIKARVKGSEGATVITFFQHQNIPAIGFGFGTSGCAHTTDEYVKIDNLYKGAKVLEEFIKSYAF